MSKNIVVFSDGTGQEGGTDHNTNVYKLFNLILDRSPRQISFYDRGLGTGWRKATGNVFGRGFSKNVKQCYQFIFENYQEGDSIFLFGFSRGAATVRSLTGFIHLFGILPRSRGKLIKKAWKIYKIKDKKTREDDARTFVRVNHNMWTKVEFLGVWDTVAALGVPSTGFDKFLELIIPHGFHDFRLSKSVNHAFHALAIDDVRKAFHPVLFHPYKNRDDKKDGERVWPNDFEQDPRVRQVWFTGMHTDVGGGYKEKGLSDIVLEWMVQQAVQIGLCLYHDKNGDKATCAPKSDGVMHDSRDTRIKKIIFKKQTRRWDKNVFGKPIIPESGILPVPVIHKSVILRADIENEDRVGRYNPWILYPEDPEKEHLTIVPEEEYETEPWTHPDDWKDDAAFANADPETMEALKGWCKKHAVGGEKESGSG